MAKSAKRLPIYEVEWVDSHTNGDWRPLREYQRIGSEPAVMRSVGYLLMQRPNVVLLQSLHPAVNRASDSMSIPRQVVRSMRRLVPA